METWFNKQHEYVIEKLADHPLLQLEYLSRVLTAKESDLINHTNLAAMNATIDTSSTLGETEENVFYQKLLKLHIELLCVHRPDEVVAELKKKYYHPHMCLEICRKTSHRPGEAYLLKKTGAFANALQVYVKLLTEVGETMLQAKERAGLRESMAKFHKLFKSALNVAKKNAVMTQNDENEQELWFTLLDGLYNVVLQTHQAKESLEATTAKEKEQEQEHNESLMLAITMLNERIKELIEAMMASVRFQTILARVTNKYGQLEVGSFKDLFLNMISSSAYQEKILETASKSIGNDLSQEFNKFVRESCKGCSMQSPICTKCQMPIEHSSSAEIVFFICKHVYHADCLRPSVTCPDCRAQAQGSTAV